MVLLIGYELLSLIARCLHYRQLVLFYSSPGTGYYEHPFSDNDSFFTSRKKITNYPRPSRNPIINAIPNTKAGWLAISIQVVPCLSLYSLRALSSQYLASVHSPLQHCLIGLIILSTESQIIIAIQIVQKASMDHRSHNQSILLFAYPY